MAVHRPNGRRWVDEKLNKINKINEYKFSEQNNAMSGYVSHHSESGMKMDSESEMKIDLGSDMRIDEGDLADSE